MHRGQEHIYGPFGPSKKPEIVALILEGSSVEAISKQLKVSRAYVYSLRTMLRKTGQYAGRNVG